jgi:hypothetical protein
MKFCNISKIQTMRRKVNSTLPLIPRDHARNLITAWTMVNEFM